MERKRELYIHIYIHTYIHLYIYIYREREREREREEKDEKRKLNGQMIDDNGVGVKKDRWLESERKTLE